MKIKIGQIGIGHNHGSAIMETLRSLPERFEVVGIVEPDPEWRKKRGDFAAYRGLPWLSEEELFHTPGLGAVAVETDAFELVPTARRCGERGFPIHLDKPGCEDLGEFRRLLDLFIQKNLTIQMGYMYRGNPALNFCFEAVRKGWLGDIFQIDAVMSRYDGDDYRKWLANFKGGAMYIFGGHLIDLVISLLGRPDRVVPFPGYTRDDGMPDNGLAVMVYPKATATIRTAVVEADGMKHRRMVICGTKGTVEVCPLEHPAARYHLDPTQVRLTLREGNEEFAAGTHLVRMPLMNGRYTSQLIEFADILEGKIANPYPPEHEFLVQEALLAAGGYFL